jgi:hypothetical protein
MSTKKLATAAVIAAISLLAACGGDDGGDSAGNAGNAGNADGRDIITGQLMEVIGTDGAEADEDCVRDVVAQLSDEDVDAIVAAGPDGDPAVSAEAEDIGMKLAECVTDFGGSLDSVVPGDVDIPDDVQVTDAMVDVMVAQIEASGMTVDRDCIGEALEGQDLAAIAENATNPEVLQSMMACVTP